MSSSLVWKAIHLGENNESETIITSPFPVHYSPLQLTRKICCCAGCKLTHVLAFLDLHKVNHGVILVQINMYLIIDIWRVRLWDGLCLRFQHHDFWGWGVWLWDLDSQRGYPLLTPLQGYLSHVPQLAIWEAETVVSKIMKTFE